MQVRPWAGLLTAVLILVGAGPACAAVDLTGRWVFTLAPRSDGDSCRDIMQSGGAGHRRLHVSKPGYSGSIDVPSGALTLSAPHDSRCARRSSTATVAPDG